jgi:DNA-binding transcriptional regulator of glucitol operon
MATVPERWLSRRAVSLHLAVLVLVAGCAVAAWWQVTRAQDGNQLSYFYSVMWPGFGILSLYFWWMLIHTDYEKVGLKGMRHDQLATASADPDTAVLTSPAVDAQRPEATVSATADDPELAAYNARLAELATQGAKTWRKREAVVVRREQ